MAPGTLRTGGSPEASNPPFFPSNRGMDKSASKLTEILDFPRNRVASDLGTPVVAAEFCGTSVSSHALPQEIFDGWRALNPNLLLARSDCRGYLRLDLTRDQLRTDLIAMDSVLEPHAPRHTLASFTVENGKPVPVRS